jgi:hypothetical protein
MVASSPSGHRFERKGNVVMTERCRTLREELSPAI